MKLPEYSVAIRTLGKSGDLFRQELESLARQTLKPQKIVVYIADGYPIPPEATDIEEYVYVKKGMVAQRALEYSEISTPYVLLLDDDVWLANNAVETMLRHLIERDGDCIAPDTFANHKMSLLQKIRAFASNLVVPHFNQSCAFKIHSYGTFSYISNPKNAVYPSESAAGPASLWKLESLKNIHYADELWLDEFGFAYGDEMLFFYKLVKNGGKLFIDFSADVKHLDAKYFRSKAYSNIKEKLTLRSMLIFTLWWRTVYNLTLSSIYKKIYCAIAFALKSLFCGFAMLAYSIFTLQIAPIRCYILGIINGYNYVHSTRYHQVASFITSIKHI